MRLDVQHDLGVLGGRGSAQEFLDAGVLHAKVHLGGGEHDSLDQFGAEAGPNQVRSLVVAEQPGEPLPLRGRDAFELGQLTCRRQDVLVAAPEDALSNPALRGDVDRGLADAPPGTGWLRTDPHGDVEPAGRGRALRRTAR